VYRFRCVKSSSTDFVRSRRSSELLWYGLRIGVGTREGSGVSLESLAEGVVSLAMARRA